MKLPLKRAEKVVLIEFVVCAAVPIICAFFRVDDYFGLVALLDLIGTVGLILLACNLFLPNTSLGFHIIVSAALAVVNPISLFFGELFPSFTGEIALGGNVFLGTAICVVVSLVIVLLFLVSALFRDPNWKGVLAWTLTALICALSVVTSGLATKLVEPIGDLIFRCDQGQYDRYVEAVRTGVVKAPTLLRQVDGGNSQMSPFGVRTIYAASWKGGLVVEFEWSDRRTRIEKGYLYKEFSDSDPLGANVFKPYKYRLRQISGNWYYFSNSN